MLRAFVFFARAVYIMVFFSFYLAERNSVRLAVHSDVVGSDVFRFHSRLDGDVEIFHGDFHP